MARVKMPGNQTMNSLKQITFFINQSFIAPEERGIFRGTAEKVSKPFGRELAKVGLVGVAEGATVEGTGLDTTVAVDGFFVE